MTKQVHAALIMFKTTGEAKKIRANKYYNILKNQWRNNLKARNSYKNLLTTIEKVCDIRVFKEKQHSYTLLKFNAVMCEPKTDNAGNDKLQLAKSQIANKEKEIELD